MKTSSPQASQRTERSQRTESISRDQETTRSDAPTAQSQQIRETVAHEEIARRAHELWEQDGRQDGRDQEYWLQAEKQLRGSSFRNDAESDAGDAHEQARAIKASAERRSQSSRRS
jgi:hypothetical protein